MEEKERLEQEQEQEEKKVSSTEISREEIEQLKTRTDFQKMSDAQLMALIAEFGLTIENKTRKAMITALREHLLKDRLDEAKEINEDGDLEPINQDKDMVKVIFHARNEQDLPYIFLGLNGKSYYIPRDKPVRIPKELIKGVVERSVEYHMEPIKEGEQIRYRIKKVHRFPYTILE